LDAFLTEHHLFSQAVSIIKIDVEGHESPVIIGSEDTIAKWRSILFVEILDRADVEFRDNFIKRHSYVDILLRPEDAVFADGPVSFDAGAWNHAFIPSERVLDFKGLDLPFKS
jgi:hypothetical protein